MCLISKLFSSLNNTTVRMIDIKSSAMDNKLQKSQFIMSTDQWRRLSEGDKMEYSKLQHEFHHSANAIGKDRRLVTFSKELLSVLQFLDRDTINREERCIVTGICFAGPFICVNTRVLKLFLGRCKSSINGSFQQMGYVAIKTKIKSRNCILSVLKQLNAEPNILRQWTVRCPTHTSEFCFISSFTSYQLPEITDADIKEDSIPQNKIDLNVKSVYMPRVLQEQVRVVEAPEIHDACDYSYSSRHIFDQYVDDNEQDFTTSLDTIEDSMWHHSRSFTFSDDRDNEFHDITRSYSAYIGYNEPWN